jgi:hypothetical protein
MPNYPYSFQLPPLNVQDIPNNGAVGEFLGISAGGVLDWLPVSASGSGDMLKSENLSGLASYPTARTNLGLGTGDSPTFKNLTISTGTITTSAPVTISQTWNGTGSTVFKALVVNATTPGTTSSASSLLLDLQVGGASKFSVDKAGVTKINNGGTLTWTSADSLVISSTSAYQRVLAYSFYDTGLGAGIGDVISSNGCRLYLGSGSGLGWFSNSTIGSGGVDTVLIRDGAANTLALRNGAAAQTFRVYNTYTDANNYSRLKIGWDAVTYAAFTIEGQQLGTGGGRSLALIGGGNVLGLGVAPSGNFNWVINSGHFLAGTDNTYDIGASGANRPRNVYAAGAVIAGGLQVISGGGIQNSIGTGANIYFISGASRLAFDLGGGVFWNDSSNNPLAAATVGVMRNATGILEVNSGTLGAFRDVRCRSVIQQPPASITPASNGDYVVEATNNTTLTFRLKGSDGVVRSATLTLAP